MPTEGSGGAAVLRLAVVQASYSAAAGAPPGVVPAAFAEACLSDTYEALADLVGVDSGIVGGPDLSEHVDVEAMLWPGALRLTAGRTLHSVAAVVPERYGELVVVPADVPDLPGLVVAKLFKALQHADVAVAPARGGAGCVAIAVRLPWAGWIPTDLDLDDQPSVRLSGRAPQRRRLAETPDWHRMRRPDDVHRLDPGLEGWEATRVLLSARRPSTTEPAGEMRRGRE